MQSSISKLVVKYEQIRKMVNCGQCTPWPGNVIVIEGT